MSLRKTTRAVTRFFERVMAESGLRVTQFILLQALVRTGPVTLSALAEQLVMDRTTLSRSLRPLIERRLVSVGPGADRRQRAVELTERGREAFATTLSSWREAQSRFVMSLGEGAWSELLSGLDAAVEVARGVAPRSAERAAH
jgi:DNA-binding MarR family transcriptional regulator